MNSKIEDIASKRIVLYGDQRYMKDFEYVFAELLSIYKCISNSDELNIKEIYGEDSAFVVICEYTKGLKTGVELQKNGYMRGADYEYADNLFCLLDYPIFDIGMKRNIYVWGCGNCGHAFFHEFVENNPNIPIVGCVDKDNAKHGKTFFRKQVYKPEDVLQDKSAFWIIAVKDAWLDVREYLEEQGLKAGIDFVHYSSINNWASWMMRETVYDNPKLDYLCKKPFTDAYLLGEGQISICAGIRDLNQRITPMYYSNFESMWKSNVMRVLRLSVINGTYTFCNYSKCNYLFNSGVQEIDTDEIHYELGRGRDTINEIRKKKKYDKAIIFDEKNYQIETPDYPSVVMCSFDRTCNLSCPSCRDGFINCTENQQKQIEELSDRFLSEVLPHIKRIKVAGDGEAFASKNYRNIMFHSGVTNSCQSIGILSNGSIFKPEYMDMLIERYKHINVAISMDGATKDTATKLRRGINFDMWLKNVEYIGKMRKMGKIDFLMFNYVVQRANYLEMPDFASMCIDMGADKVKFSKISNTGKFTEEEFDNMSMFDAFDNPKQELIPVLTSDVLQCEKVSLFQWVDW